MPFLIPITPKQAARLASVKRIKQAAWPRLAPWKRIIMASVKASLRLSMPIARDLSLVVIWFGLVC
jgi:hypothetical protein